MDTERAGQPLSNPPYPQYPQEDAPRPAPMLPPPYPASLVPHTAPIPGDPDYDDRYRKAKRRVAELKGFYSHLSVYVGVIGLLFFINLFTSHGYWWFLWAAFGWAIGLLSHAWATFNPARHLGSEWEARQIQREMRRRP